MTTTYKISKSFDWQGRATKKVAQVLRSFGLNIARLRNNGIKHECEIKLAPGQVCFITGASGSGKSVILREFYSAIADDEKINLSEIDLPDDKTCIDCFDGDWLAILRYLSRAGLNDVFTALNRPARLSDGQKYRFRLAKALASKRRFIFADEFCSNLDRITAAVIAFNVRRFAKQNNVTFILASSHDDLLADLAPDVIVIKHLTGSAEVIYKND